MAETCHQALQMLKLPMPMAAQHLLLEIYYETGEAEEGWHIRLLRYKLVLYFATCCFSLT